MKIWNGFSLLAVLAAGLLFSVPPARAQASTEKNPADALATLKHWSTELNLTEAQKKQLMPIVMEQTQKLKAWKEDTASTRMQKVMKLRSIHQDTDTKVKPILTPDQFTKFQAMRQAEMQKIMEQHKAAS
ncbi:MAG: hypothetical protein ACRD4K_10865 [Candidatus Acidiferrales bacterium]